MKISFLDGNITDFEDLKKGDTFVYNNMVYLITDEMLMGSGERIRAVCLKTGTLCDFFDDTVVHKVYCNLAVYNEP